MGGASDAWPNGAAYERAQKERAFLKAVPAIGERRSGELETDSPVSSHAADLCDLFCTDGKTAQQPSRNLHVTEALAEGAADLVVKPRDPVVEAQSGLCAFVEIGQPSDLLPVLGPIESRVMCGLTASHFLANHLTAVLHPGRPQGLGEVVQQTGIGPFFHQRTVLPRNGDCRVRFQKAPCRLDREQVRVNGPQSLARAASSPGKKRRQIPLLGG